MGIISKERRKGMTIKGTSDIRRLPRLGKIRLGIKLKNQAGVEYPKAVDYFVCPEEVQGVYGEKPTELRIAFPVEDSGKFAPQSYSCYSATRGLTCRGDGEMALRMFDKKTGDIAHKDAVETEMRSWRCHPIQETAEDNQPLCREFIGEGYKAPQCRRLMQLQFMLPDVAGLGVWQLDTSSFHNIVALNSVLDILRSLTAPPRVSMIPLRMILIPREGQVEGKKKSFHILQFVVPYSLSELNLLIQKPPLQALIGVPEEPEAILEGDPDEESEEVALSSQSIERDIAKLKTGEGLLPEVETAPQPQKPEDPLPSGPISNPATKEQRAALSALLTTWTPRELSALLVLKTGSAVSKDLTVEKATEFLIFMEQMDNLFTTAQARFGLDKPATLDFLGKSYILDIEDPVSTLEELKRLKENPEEGELFPQEGG